MANRGTLTVFCLCALITAARGQVSDQPSSSPQLTILSPGAGSVVNGGALVEATIIPPLPTYSVRFFFSRDRKKFTEITAPAPDGLAPYGVVWDTRSVPGGRYFLRAEAAPRDGGSARAIVQTIRVTVNEQPTAVAKATISKNEPLELTFDGRGSSDGDGKIRSYRWDFEDGTFGTGPRVTHRYPGPGHYAFGLTVIDDRGGRGTTHHTIDITGERREGRLRLDDQLKSKCGCEKMRIKDGDNIDGPDGFEFDENTSGIPAAEAKKLGGYNAGAANNKLDLTKGPFAIKTRFEVIATLTKDSEPALCTEGQRVKRSSFSKGVTTDKEGKYSSDPRYDSSKGDDPYAPAPAAGTTPPKEGKCGETGDKWCDDDYHGGEKVDGSGKVGNDPPNGYKRYDGERRILWIDAPGPRNLTKAEIVDQGFSYGAKFEARVSGAGGSCKCSWETHIDIQKDGTINGNKVTDISCAP